MTSAVLLAHALTLLHRLCPEIQPQTIQSQLFT